MQKVLLMIIGAMFNSQVQIQPITPVMTSASATKIMNCNATVNPKWTDVLFPLGTHKCNSCPWTKNLTLDVNCQLF